MTLSVIQLEVPATDQTHIAPPSAALLTSNGTPSAHLAGEWLAVRLGERSASTPDTVTGIFNRLVGAADSRRIRLHDVRHTYSTLSRLIEGAVGGSEGTAPEAC